MRYHICLLVFLTSCCMYKRDFDCPPAKGIPCTPVTTLERMIVESPCGPDEFLGCVPKLVDVQKDPTCRCTSNAGPTEPFQRRIWISSPDERPSYIYFKEEDACEQ